MKQGILLSLFIAGSLGATPSYGQSIADAARLQAQRLGTTGAPARIYTGTDVRETTGTITESTALGSPALAAASNQVSAQPTPEDFSPARYGMGPLPPIPGDVVGGGQVFLEVTVGSDGRVTQVAPFRTTPPYDTLMTHAVTNWQFLPAERLVRRNPDERPVRERVESRVLVAGQFRPPAIYVGTLGEVPRTAAAAPEDIPAPTVTVEPPHAINAFGAGVVLVEVGIDRSGAVYEVNLVQTAPPYDQLALNAARQWRFRPARVDGQLVNSVAYLVFGFAVPSTGTPCASSVPQGTLQTNGLFQICPPSQSNRTESSGASFAAGR